MDQSQKESGIGAERSGSREERRVKSAECECLCFALLLQVVFADNVFDSRRARAASARTQDSGIEGFRWSAAQSAWQWAPARRSR